MSAVVNGPSAESYFRAGDPAVALLPLRLAASVALLSFGAALFALACFKLLSFFVMPSLFFDLLFIGFPVGAMLAARVLKTRRLAARHFVAALFILQGVMLFSVLAGLFAKRFDYLRAHLFDVELAQLAGQVGIFVLLFLPYFAAYGMCEFLAYHVGRAELGGKLDRVYALALFGAAAAYPALKTALPLLGMAKILGVAFAAVALAVACIGTIAQRRVAFFQLAIVASEMIWPGIEPRFLALYKGQGDQSTWDYQTRLGCRPVFQAWGRYALCEIMAGPDRQNYYGFYNDMFQWEYAPRHGFLNPGLGVLPLVRTPPDARIAIIGAGGGRQVRLAQLLNEQRRIVALELEPAVFDAVRGRDHLLHRFARVYEHPQVRAVRAEARGYLETHAEPFDLIYLPSVGGYAQMMIEPGNMIRTLEAHRLIRERLTPRGVLAIWYPLGLDSQGVLTRQYVRTLRRLGMPTAAYRNSVEWLILAYRDPGAPPPTPDALWAGLGARVSDAHAADLKPADFDVPADSTFTPITDERPFLAGNVRHILNTRQVATLFAAAAAILAVVGVALHVRLKSSWSPGPRPYRATSLLALLLGANFVIIEHTVVLALFRRQYVYDDALTQGAIAFLVLTGIGSLLASRGPRQLLAALAFVALLIAVPQITRLEWPHLFVLLAPVAIATGTFFPALFDKCAASPLPVFAMDAVGAGLGAVAATFVPILWGFTPFFVLAAAVFLATLVFDSWYHKPTKDTRTAPQQTG